MPQKSRTTSNRWEPFENYELEVIQGSMDLNAIDHNHTIRSRLFEELQGEIDRRWNDSFTKAAEKERQKGQGPFSS